jgi:hypothetical protein
VPSLLLAATLVIIGVQFWIFGIVADVIATNRKLLEDIQLRTKRLEYAKAAAAAAIPGIPQDAEPVSFPV